MLPRRAPSYAIHALARLACACPLALLGACAATPRPHAGAPPAAAADTALHQIRINQPGYLPEAPKVAVLCSLEPRRFESFHVVAQGTGRRVLGPLRAVPAGGFGPCVEAWRLDFSAPREEGEYHLVVENPVSPPVRVGAGVYRGAADVLLAYLRQQRSGFNPFFRESVHRRADAILVDHPTREGEFIPVPGGWADAADYLQYVATSASATFLLMQAWRDHPGAFGDSHDARGLPGANGVPDVLDEARHGLEWLARMYPEDELMLDPHSIVARQYGPLSQRGGLVDGPVYRSIFENLQWVRLVEPDEYARFNTGPIVYRDDFGDYPTNEPIMDGTANLTYVLSALAPAPAHRGGRWPRRGRQALALLRSGVARGQGTGGRRA